MKHTARNVAVLGLATAALLAGGGRSVAANDGSTLGALADLSAAPFCKAFVAGARHAQAPAPGASQ